MKQTTVLQKQRELRELTAQRIMKGVDRIILCFPGAVRFCLLITARLYEVPILLENNSFRYIMELQSCIDKIVSLGWDGEGWGGGGGDRETMLLQLARRSASRDCFVRFRAFFENLS